MGQISLQIPVALQLNSTEDPKIASDFTTLQTVINGNLDDTNLYAPNNAVRRTLLQATGPAYASSTAAGDWLITPPGAYGSNITPAQGQVPPVWWGDVGLSSQPQDFQVAHKTAYARLRVSLLVNGVTPGCTFTFGLYQITGLGGGFSGLVMVFGSAVSGTTVAQAAPALNSSYGLESAQFALPSAGVPYALGCNTSGGMAANSCVGITASLVAYNA